MPRNRALIDRVELTSAALHTGQEHEPDRRGKPEFPFNTDDFFINREQWDIALAQRIAHSEDMGEMDELQQELLLTLRDEFQKIGAVTALSHTCHLNGLDAVVCISI